MTNRISLPRSGRWLGLVLCGAALALLVMLPGFRSIVHESDQAAILRGAWALAHGESSPWHADFYNYDRLFFSYWLVAAGWRVARLFSEHPDIVLIGNVLSSSFLSLALLRLLWRKARWLPFGLILSAILAPALLMHAPFLAATSLSGGFLLLLFTSLSRPGPARLLSWRVVWTGLLAFAAVGCRADAVLVLPGLCWLTIWPVRAPWRMGVKPRFWAAVGGALAALFTGSAIAAEAGPLGYPPFFAPKIFAAYTVFGLGAVVLLLGWASVWMARSAFLQHGWRRGSYLAGLVMLWLPPAYYVPQLFSTRHWTTTIVLMLLVLCSRRWLAAWKLWSRRLVVGRRPLATLAMACAVVPVFVGISLPTFRHPRLSRSHATTFPSADGLLPMGGYLGRTWGSSRRLPDHNQAAWTAVLQAKLEPGPDGVVPILNTPLHEILQLACSVRRLRSRLVKALDPSSPMAYVEVRSLIKSGGWDEGPVSPNGVGGPLARWRLMEVSPRVDGAGIVLLDTRAPAGPENALWEAAIAVFQGNDFHLFPLSERMTDDGALQLPLGEGKAVAFFSRRPFTIVAGEGERPRWASPPAPGPHGYYSVLIPGAETLGLSGLFFESEAPFDRDSSVGQAALPDYMSMRAFGGP